MTTEKRATGSARERLLSAADRLFYDEGIGAVGIERVIDVAGTARGSLYYNFGNKDELAASYLQARRARWDERAQAGMAAVGTDPAARILAVFDTLHALVTEHGYKGCAFMNAAAEARSGTPEEDAINQFRSWLHNLFYCEAVRIPGADPAVLTRRLVLLFDGAGASAAADHRADVALDARAMAQALLP